jgi:Uma2 family endonuclease
MSTAPMTAEEYWEWWGQQKDDGNDCRYELHQGRVVRFSPAGQRHGFVCANVGFLFWPYARKRGGFGSINNPCLLVGRNPDTVLAPDLLLFDGPFPKDEVNDSFWTRVPVLAVEVINIDDTWGAMNRRVTQLLQRGVPNVWVIDPESQNVSTFSPGESVRVLEGEDLLPLLEVPARSCFHTY